MTFFDVTDRMQAQRKLAEAEEESRLAFDGSRVATCLVSNDGRLTRVNPAMCDLLGRTEAELLTMGFLEVTHPDDAGLSADLVRDLIEGRRSSLRVTKRYVTGNGRVIWGDVTVSRRAQRGRIRPSPHRADPRRHRRARPPALADGGGADRPSRRLAAGPGHRPGELVARAVHALRAGPRRTRAGLPRSGQALHRRELAAPAGRRLAHPGDRHPLRARARAGSAGRLASLDGGPW